MMGIEMDCKKASQIFASACLPFPLLTATTAAHAAANFVL
jgi:hypothetical protein